MSAQDKQEIENVEIVFDVEMGESPFIDLREIASTLSAKERLDQFLAWHSNR
jgi:hypothetical protein